MILDSLNFFFSKSRIVLLAIPLSLIISFLPSAYGHGIGAEVMPPVMIGNKNVTLAINEFPSPDDPTGRDKALTIQLYDTHTKIPVRDVTFFVKASKDNKVLFERTFERDKGFLSLIIHTTESGGVSFDEGNPFVILFKSLIGEKSGTVTIHGPIFDTGGLYKFHIEISSIDSYANKLANLVKYDPSISIPDTTSYKINDKNYGSQKLNITSYYDVINNFQYLPETKSIKFDMPFDWSAENINQVSVVHEEFHIPKTFGDLLVTKYKASVNGLQLQDRTVLIDDYSSENRIVHVVINRAYLQEIAKIPQISKIGMEFVLEPSKEASFPVIASSGKYEVHLSWDPPNIVSGSSTRFSFDIFDLYVNATKPISASYDFSIRQNENIFFRHKDTTTSGTKSVIEVPIPNDVSGPIKIRFENLGGQNRMAEFLAAVNKASDLNMSIKLTSFVMQDGQKLAGNYQVDLSWSPGNMPINDQIKFEFEIKDKNSNPVESEYDFVILQNGTELYHKSGVAKYGYDSATYTFAGGHEGPAILRIENIGISKESVELAFVVTPEFPLALISFVLATVMAAVLIFNRATLYR